MTKVREPGFLHQVSLANPTSVGSSRVLAWVNSIGIIMGRWTPRNVATLDASIEQPEV